MNESKMKTIPGTVCTKNKFSIPIVKTTIPNIQLIIRAVLNS